MKSIFTTIITIIITLCLNFGLFLYSYKKLAFPYLHEAQRMDNAPLIFSYVLAGFLFISICSVVGTYLLSRKNA